MNQVTNPSVDDSEQQQYTFDDFYRVATHLRFSERSYCAPTFVAIRAIEPGSGSGPGCRIYFISYPRDANTARGVPTLFCADVFANGQYTEELSWFHLLPGDFALSSSVSLAESLLRERMRMSARGVASFELKHGNRLVLTAASHLYCAIDRTDVREPPHLLEPLAAPVSAPLQPQICPFNPDLVACVAGGQLTVGHTPTNTWTPLTHVDSNSGITAAMPSYVIQEEFDRYIGFWWQPSREATTPATNRTYRILYEWVDEREVSVVNLLAGQTVESHRYPRAGATNATSDLRICEFELTDAGEISNLRHLSLPRTLLHYIPGNFEYLVRAGWTPDGQYVWCQLLTRTQGRLELILIPLSNFTRQRDPASDASRVEVPSGPCIRLLAEEDEELWIEVHNHLVFLADSPSQSAHSNSTSNGTRSHDFQRMNFIWTSHRSGFSHLYLMRRAVPNGGLIGSATSVHPATALVIDAEEISTAQLTNGQWEVTGTEIWVDEKSHLVYFEANREHPILWHIYAVSYALVNRGQLFCMTPSSDAITGDNHSSVNDNLDHCTESLCFDPAFPPISGKSRFPLSYNLEALDSQFGWAVISSSSWDQTVGVQILRITMDPVDRNPQFSHLAWLQRHMSFADSLLVPTSHFAAPPRVLRYDLAADPSAPRNTHSESPDLLDPLASNIMSPLYLYGLLFTPKYSPPPGGYPTVHFVYGGPNVQLVKGAYSKSIALHALLYCYFGYAVLLCDCRGSANRGMRFAGHLKNRLGMVELDDHVAFLQFVAKQTQLIDLSRVAITGYSYGGYMSLMAAMRYSHVYKAAIAGSPVVDWTMYDTAYTERYMGLPGDNALGYWAANVINHIDRMPTDTLRLLIGHGGLDENVHFHHTAALVHELETTGKPFELLFYPTSRHGIKEYEHMEASLLHLLENVLRPIRPCNTANNLTLLPTRSDESPLDDPPD